MGKVYVVQKHLHRDESGALVPKYDEAPARVWGDIEYLLSPNAKPFNTASVLSELDEKLSRFDPERDFLLLTGNPVLIALASTVAFRHSRGKVRFLQWRGVDCTFVPIEAVLPWARSPLSLVER